MCKCNQCGYVNDSLLTNCLYCKSPIQNNSSISNELLVMEAAKWVTHTSSEFMVISNKGLIPKTITNTEIKGIANSYLSLLSIRSASNSILSTTYQTLKNEYNSNSKKANNKTLVRVIVGGLLMLLPFIYGLIKLL